MEKLIKERLMIFDLARIGAILLVVGQHILGKSTPTITIPDYEIVPIGKIGVIIFVFISGALLFIKSEKVIFDMSNAFVFYYKKWSRLYPAMWISLLIAIILNPGVLHFQTLKYWLVQLTGTLIYFVDFNNPIIWGKLINPLTYFVGLIAGLYAIYPLIHNLIKKYPYLTLFGTIVISILSTKIFHLTLYSGNPLAYLMYFVFGISVAQFGIYPKTKIGSDSTIVKLSELSFYIFLTHNLIIQFWKITPILFISSATLLAYMIMLLDNKMQDYIEIKSLNYCGIK